MNFRERLLEAIANRPKRIVNVPDPIEVRQMSISDETRISILSAGAPEGDRTRQLAALLVCTCFWPETGDPVFTDSDVNVILNAPKDMSDAIGALMNAAVELNYNTVKESTLDQVGNSKRSPKSSSRRTSRSAPESRQPVSSASGR